MPETPRTALVVGGTGLVGGALLPLLLTSPVYTSVRSLVRRATGNTHPKLDERVVSFDDEATLATHVAGDDIFCCLGTTMKQAGSKEAFHKVDVEYPLRIAKLAIATGAKQYLLVSSLGASQASFIFFNREKGLLEHSLQTLGFAGLHIVRPAILLGNREQKRAGEELAQQFFRAAGKAFVGGLKKYRAIPATHVASALAHIAYISEPGLHIYESDALWDWAGA